MSLAKAARELVTAFAVLALVFLSLGQPVAMQPVHPTSLATPIVASTCGGNDPSGALGHTACHACRSGDIALPPPPCVAEPAFAGFVTVDYIVIEPPAFIVDAVTPQNPRAPPLTA